LVGWWWLMVVLVVVLVFVVVVAYVCARVVLCVLNVFLLCLTVFGHIEK
jgi:hypothetical protein